MSISTSNSSREGTLLCESSISLGVKKGRSAVPTKPADSMLLFVEDLLRSIEDYKVL